MVLSPVAAWVQFWPPIPALTISHRTDKSRVSSRKDKLQNHCNFKSLLFPLPLKVNFYVTPETNSMESGAEGTYGLFSTLCSASALITTKLFYCALARKSVRAHSSTPPKPDCFIVQFLPDSKPSSAQTDICNGDLFMGFQRRSGMRAHRPVQCAFRSLAPCS